MKTKIISLFTIFIILIISITHVTHAQVLQLTLTTNKPKYTVGENVLINGTLSVGGSPVNGLVALQILDPHGSDFLFRVCPTGLPTGPWDLEILEVITCYQNGTPKDSFKRGTNSYAKITVQNNEVEPIYAVITLTLYDKANAVQLTMISSAGNIAPGLNPPMIVSVPIPAEASLGTAKLYADILTDEPKNNGYAHSPEKTATFTITTTSSFTNIFYNTLSTYGAYNATFRLPSTGAILGNYTVYASCKYVTLYAQTSRKFEIILLGDVNGDGKVDITDISMVIAVYGTNPKSPRWNPNADINNDGKIDITDVSIVIAQYGKHL